MDDFVHLHSHDTYSWLDGWGHPEQFVARAKELGQCALATTNHGNVSSHKKHFDACREAGIKPILGCECYIVNDASIKNQRQMFHITLLAKNIIGYRNLLKLVTASWNTGFYYKPRIDWNQLKACSAGLTGTSGCPSGRIGRGITKDHWSDQQVVEELKRQASLFESGSYFAELMPLKYEDGIKVNEMVYKAALKEGIQPLLSMDAHYPLAENAHVQDVMLCINANVKFSDPNRLKFSQQDYCLHSGADMEMKWRAIHGNRLPFLDEMITNTKKVADSVELEFPTTKPLEFPHNGDKNKYLKQLCEQGLKFRKLEGKPGYKERLEYEFNLVLSKNFVDYFLIVQDLIVWAKNSGIVVGAARGSSCGSLMCYLLRITEVDPIPHKLMFERFIDVSRADLPDIDIDFESERRNEVKTYLELKYGSDRVANLATFGTFKGRLCIQDIQRVFSDKIPLEAAEECKRLIIQRSSADARAGFTIEDTFSNFENAAEHLKKYPELGLAKQLEGQIRQLGVHAAGVVISNEPIGNFAAVYVTKNKDKVISMDYDDASSVGLLKIDVLGLTALTIVKKVLALVKRHHDKDVDLYSIPIDDEKVYENFCKVNLRGIFQFEGKATRDVCRQMQPKNFQDLVAINALSRPGPSMSGVTSSFLARRNGEEKTEACHDVIKEVMGATHNLPIYQEQVMMIVRLMGKFDWAETAYIRKAMSKKLGNETLNKMRDKFVAGAASQGVVEEIALATWKNICTHGAWSFNMSHSVAYTIAAYQMMWLKTYYPVEFYACIIDCETDDNKRRSALNEYKNNGFAKLLPVCINSSRLGMSCEDGLRLGFDSIIGLGTVMADKIISGQPFKDYIDFDERCNIPSSQKEKLMKIGAFRDLNFTDITRQEDLFGGHKAVKYDSDYRHPKQSDVIEFCPLAVENKVNSEWQHWLKENCKGGAMPIVKMDDIEGKTEVLIIGRTDPRTRFQIKNKIEECQSRGQAWEAKSGEEELTKEAYTFLNFDMDDETDSTVVRVSYKLYPKHKAMLWAIKPDDVIGVRGMCNGEMRMVFSHNVVNLTNLKAKIEAKQPLTKTEQEFLDGKGGRRTNRRQQQPEESGCGF